MADKKLIALGIVCMFLLVGTITTSASEYNIPSVTPLEEPEELAPAGLIDKHIEGVGEIGLAFISGTNLIAIAKKGTPIQIEYYYHIYPSKVITRNASFAILIRFTGSLDQSVGVFRFEGDVWLNVLGRY